MDAVDREIARVACRQQDNITRQQLLALGLGRAAIAYRIRSGRIYPEHAGVYAVGRPARTPLQRASAAVLACGPEAALSHQSAFMLWDFDRTWTFPVHVSSPTCRKRPRIITHRVPSLARQDIRTRLGVRVTSPARTFLDCAPTLTRKRLRRALADARRSGRLQPAALQDVLDRFPTHPGHASLAAAAAGYQPTRSELEDAFVAFCATHNLPTPIINSSANGYEVDALFPGHNVIVELDGWDYHRDRHSFEGDRDRDATNLAEGQPTVRITWERMTETPAREANRLRQILARFGPAADRNQSQ